MQLLFVVEDVFAIKERGIIAIGQLSNLSARFRVGDSVQVRRLNGSVVTTTITGIPMGMMIVGKVEVMLRCIAKTEVKPGDEVWIADIPVEPVAAADSPREHA